MQAIETPWLPEDNFAADNAEALTEIFAYTRQRFPDEGTEVLQVEDHDISQEARDWMWQRFMGHQHGSLEGRGGKVELTETDEAKLLPLIGRLNYGPHNFLTPTPPPADTVFTNAYILGGMPQEITDRLMTSIDHQPHNEAVRQIVCMVGQRLRWQVPGERTTREVYDMVARYSGTDIDDLSSRSPWIRTEAAKKGSEWEQPFATEYAMGRLSVEAVFDELIDWRNYPVDIVHDTDADPLNYETAGGIKTVPPREQVMATYHLTDGRQVHVFNAKATPRPNAMPRPTSDTQTREVLHYVPLKANESILTAASAPHVRAAMDALIRILSLQGDRVQRAAMSSGQWVPNVDVLSALGEIPATYKADRRLRAVLNGNDPDTPDLQKL